MIKRIVVAIWALADRVPRFEQRRIRILIAQGGSWPPIPYPIPPPPRRKICRISESYPGVSNHGPKANANDAISNR
jgi:hypothetical protein